MSNIIPPNMHITQQDREKRNGHSAIIIWFTGLSGAGKSTIASVLEKDLFDQGMQVVMLDGDALRTGLNSDLKFSDSDRVENIRRSAEVARLFYNAGFVVLASFITPKQEMRNLLRSTLTKCKFVEVYIKADVATCKNRDVKGLYKKAALGEIKDFTGINSDFEEPITPDVEIDTEKLTVNQSIYLLKSFLRDNYDMQIK